MCCFIVEWCGLFVSSNFSGSRCLPPSVVVVVASAVVLEEKKGNGDGVAALFCSVFGQEFVILAVRENRDATL